MRELFVGEKMMRELFSEEEKKDEKTILREKKRMRKLFLEKKMMNKMRVRKKDFYLLQLDKLANSAVANREVREELKGLADDQFTGAPVLQVGDHLKLN